MQPYLAWVALLATACGGGADPIFDAAPDATEPLPDAACSLPSGRDYVTTMISLLPSTEGLDLDLDGVPDNALGAMPAAARDEANRGINEAILSGQLLMGFRLTNWSDPPTVDDPDLSLLAFQLIDADNPPVNDNNFQGEGKFTIRIDQFDLQCRTRNEADVTTLTSGTLWAENDLMRFPLTIGTGALEFTDVQILENFAPDFASASGMLGATMSFCSLAAMPFPGTVAGTVLDALVNDPTMKDIVLPDMDVDGDGMERIEGDGISILRCIDGDGTVIDDPACACYPTIQDGYSVAVEWLFVSCTIVGVL